MVSVLRNRGDDIWTVKGKRKIGENKYIFDKEVVNGKEVVDSYLVQSEPTGVTDNWVHVIRLKLFDRRKDLPLSKYASSFDTFL